MRVNLQALPERYETAIRSAEAELRRRGLVEAADVILRDLSKVPAAPRTRQEDIRRAYILADIHLLLLRLAQSKKYEFLREVLVLGPRRSAIN